MAQASVFECVHMAGQISVFASWNYARTNNRVDVVSSFIFLISLKNLNNFKKFFKASKFCETSRGKTNRWTNLL